MDSGYLDVEMVFAPETPCCGTCLYWRESDNVCFRYPKHEIKVRTDLCGEHPYSDEWIEFMANVEAWKRRTGCSD